MRSAPRFRNAILIVGASAALVFPFLAYVWAHVEIVSTGYTIEETEARLKAAEQANRALRFEKARLTSLSRIEERARKLGLVPVPSSRIVVLAPRVAPPRPEPPPLPSVSPVATEEREP